MNEESAVPSTLRRPRARLLLVVLAAVAVLGLSSCAGQRDPGSYTAGVKDQFTRSCWIQLLLDANGTKVQHDDPLATRQAKAEKDATDSQVTKSQTYCKCVYSAIRKKVPFGEFKSANDELRNEGGKLPSDITKAYASCKAPSLEA